MPDLEHRVSDEIIALHDRLQAWFRGEGDEDGQVVLSRMTPDYLMVGAAGRLVSLETFTKVLPSLRGSRPGLVMEIFDVRVLHQFPGGVLAFYREVQTQGEARTERWSSVLFVEGADGRGLLWKHLQETFLA